MLYTIVLVMFITIFIIYLLTPNRIKLFNFNIEINKFPFYFKKISFKHVLDKNEDFKQV